MMPAPSSSVIFSGIDGRLTPPFQSPRHSSFNQFLNDLSSQLASQWSSWQSGLTGGKNNVSGLGIGAWIGTGGGGTITEGSPLEIAVTTYSAPAFEQYVGVLKDVFKEKFNLWTTSFVFSAVPYLGTSTATPLSPGSFNATGATPPAPIGTLGSGTNPASIKSEIESRLSSPFDLPKASLHILNQAIEDTIVEQFSIWLLSSMFTGDSVTGAAAPGSGSGAGMSQGNGMIV